MADPRLVAVPRKWVITWLIVTVGLFIGIGGSYLYTQYVAQQLCGVITISNDAYKNNPNPSVTVQTLKAEFSKLERKYRCR